MSAIRGWSPLLRSWRGAWLVVASLAFVGDALADKGDVPMKGEAQALFEDARRLTAEGKYSEACPKLAESLRLNPGIGVRYYLAECLERTGKLATAWGLYVEAADLAKLAGQAGREQHARARADALKLKLTRMVVIVPEEVRALAGLEVRRNDAVMGAGSWGVPVPVDPGRHVISVVAPGKKRWDSAVDATGEGATITVMVPALGDEVPAPPTSTPAQPQKSQPETTRPEKNQTTGPSGGPATPPKATSAVTSLPTAAPPAREAPASAGWSPQKTIALVVGGAGVVGVGLGTGFGIDAVMSVGEADDHCTSGTPGACDPIGVAAMQSARSS